LPQCKFNKKKEEFYEKLNNLSAKHTLSSPEKAAFVEKSGDIYKKWIEQVKSWRDVHGQTFSATVNRDGVWRLTNWNSDLENLLMAEIFQKWETIRRKVHSIWKSSIHTIISQVQTNVSAFRTELLPLKLPTDTVEKICAETLSFTKKFYPCVQANYNLFCRSQAKHRDKMVDSIKTKLLPVYQKASVISGDGRANTQCATLQEFITTVGHSFITEILHDAENQVNTWTHQHIKEISNTLSQIVSGVKEIIGVICKEQVVQQHENPTLVDSLDNSSQKLKEIQFQLDWAVQELSFESYVPNELSQ